jgi:hypothetical protein
MSIPLDEAADFIDAADLLSKAKLEKMGIQITHIRG